MSQIETETNTLFTCRAPFFIRLLMMALLTVLSFRALADDLVRPEVWIDQVESVGLRMTARYANAACPSLAMQVDLYTVTNGAAEFHDRCLVNAGWAVDSSGALQSPSFGFCYFKRPIPPGTFQSLIVRAWKSSPNCANFADQIGRVADGYVDYPVNTIVQASTHYPALTQQRTIEISRRYYSLKMDRNGGATFEFYNNRASRNGVSEISNAIHANVGAALQVAIHHHEGLGFIKGSCDGVDYWNPNQAGYFCSRSGGAVNFQPDAPYPGPVSGLNIFCDGVYDNNCRWATNQVQFTNHRMYAWAYGDSYQGPYNPLDTAYLSQNVTAREMYVEYDLTYQNVGFTMRGPIEIPTFYFTNKFRRAYFVDKRGYHSIDIPLRTTAAPVYNIGRPSPNEDISWVSFENTTGVQYDTYTIAWFYKPDTLADMVLPGFDIAEDPSYKNIKFTNQPIFHFQKDKVYRFKYVVFPFRFDDVVDSPYGRMRVDQIIPLIRNDYAR
jgi:hypothetical protein